MDSNLQILSGGRVIANAGRMTLGFAGTVRIDTGGATINNTGTFTFADDATFTNSSGAILFVNDGLARKTAGTGASGFGQFQNNATGTVQAQSGVLSLFSPSGTTSTYAAGGTLNVSAWTAIDTLNPESPGGRQV